MSKRQKYSILNIFLTLVLVGLIGIGVTKGDRVKADPPLYVPTVTITGGDITHNSQFDDDITVTATWTRLDLPNTGEHDGLFLYHDGDEVDWEGVELSNTELTGTADFAVSTPLDLTHINGGYEFTLKFIRTDSTGIIKSVSDTKTIWHLDNEPPTLTVTDGDPEDLTHYPTNSDIVRMNIAVEGMDDEGRDLHYSQYAVMVMYKDRILDIWTTGNLEDNDWDKEYNFGLAQYNQEDQGYYGYPAPSASYMTGYPNHQATITPNPSTSPAVGSEVFGHADTYNFKVQLFPCYGDCATLPIPDQEEEWFATHRNGQYNPTLSIKGKLPKPITHVGPAGGDTIDLEIEKYYTISSPYPRNAIILRHEGEILKEWNTEEDHWSGEYTVEAPGDIDHNDEEYKFWVTLYRCPEYLFEKVCGKHSHTYENPHGAMYWYVDQRSVVLEHPSVTPTPPIPTPTPSSTPGGTPNP